MSIRKLMFIDSVFLYKIYVCRGGEKICGMY